MVRAVEIFSDGFESGDFSAWDDYTASATVQSSVKHSGSYAMYVTSHGEDNYTMIQRDSEDVLYVSGWYYLSQYPDAGGDTCSAFLIGLGWYGDRVRLDLTYGNGVGLEWEFMWQDADTSFKHVENVTGVPSLDTWFFLEIMWSRGEDTAVPVAWVNGQVEFTFSGAYPDYGLTDAYCGVKDEALENFGCYVDDFKVTTTYEAYSAGGGPTSYVVDLTESFGNSWSCLGVWNSKNVLLSGEGFVWNEGNGWVAGSVIGFGSGFDWFVWIPNLPYYLDLTFNSGFGWLVDLVQGVAEVLTVDDAVGVALLGVVCGVSVPLMFIGRHRKRKR